MEELPQVTTLCQEAITFLLGTLQESPPEHARNYNLGCAHSLLKKEDDVKIYLGYAVEGYDSFRN